MYTALVLNSDSKNALRDGLRLPADWDVKCHHMTINMGLAAHGPAAELIGREFQLEATALAFNEKVMAVAVETDCPSVNANKHITVAVNVAGGGKPKHSNDLKTWNPLNKRIVLRGVVQEVQ